MTPDLFLRGARVLPAPDADVAYPFAIPALRDLDLKFTAPVVFFVGENGSGKSTLLEALAVASGFNPEGGSRNMQLSTTPTHSPLHERLRLVRSARRPKNGFFLRAESFYNVASEVDRLNAIGGTRPLLDSYGGKSLHAQSHGESFLSLILNRFSGEGLYMLDEPEAALSPSRQLGLLVRIHDLIGSGSQLIIATHSPILMGFPGAQILNFGEDGLTPVRYEDTEHFTVTRRFLADREGMLKHLLAEE